MDIIRTRQEKRARQIEQIIKTIEKAKNKEIDYHKLLLTIMREFGISKRTAVEYLEVAKFNTNIGKTAVAQVALTKAQEICDCSDCGCN